MKIATTRLQKIISLYVLALLALLTTVVLNNNYYFGFNGHVPVPEYAGYTDRDCDRTQVKQFPCRYNFAVGDNKEKIALIGDSHAAGLSDVVVKFAKARRANLDIWTRTGCKYVPANILTRQQIAYFKKNSGDCEERNRFFSEQLASGNYSKIIISWRSTDCRDNRFIGTCSKEFVQLMEASLASLSKFSEVIVVGPNFEYFDKKFLKPTVLFANPRKEPKFVYWNELIPSAEREAKSIRELRLSNVRYIDPRETFCNLDGCFLSLGGKWIMKDNNHLSRHGSMFLLKSLLTA